MLVSSGGLGTMGFGLPAAVGATMGRRDQPVILVTGDGSIQMTIQELATMREQELPIKIFIFNNQALGMVRQLQDVYCEGRNIATLFKFHPDFAHLAGAYGMPGYTIDKEADFEAALPGILATPGAVLVNCLIPTAENVSPMVLAGAGIHEAVDV